MRRLIRGGTTYSCFRVSVEVPALNTSHTLTVRSQEPLDSTAVVGLNDSEDTGPSWPDSTSSSLAVCRDHTYTLKGSSAPAQTTSPAHHVVCQRMCTAEATQHTLQQRTTRVGSHTKELYGGGRGHGSEVAVADQVVGPHSAVE